MTVYKITWALVKKVIGRIEKGLGLYPQGLIKCQVLITVFETLGNVSCYWSVSIDHVLLLPFFFSLSYIFNRNVKSVICGGIKTIIWNWKTLVVFFSKWATTDVFFALFWTKLWFGENGGGQNPEVCLTGHLFPVSGALRQSRWLHSHHTDFFVLVPQQCGHALVIFSSWYLNWHSCLAVTLINGKAISNSSSSWQVQRRESGTHENSN